MAVGVFCIGWGGNQFTPLLIAYRQQAGYSRVDVDVLLGAYVIGLVPGLLLASVLSEPIWPPPADDGRHGQFRTGKCSAGHR